MTDLNEVARAFEAAAPARQRNATHETDARIPWDRVGAAAEPEWLTRLRDGRGASVAFDTEGRLEEFSYQSSYVTMTPRRKMIDLTGVSLLSPLVGKVLRALIALAPELRGYQIRADGPAQPVDRVLKSRSPKYSMPKHLYHGTSSALLPAIMSKGLQPRTATNIKPSYQGGAAAGQPDRVYLAALTSLQATHFAAREAARKHGGKPVVLRITTKALRWAGYRPDEDANVWSDTDWIASLQKLGTVAYVGTIPPAAIKVWQRLEDRTWVRAAVDESDGDLSLAPQLYRRYTEETKRLTEVLRRHNVTYRETKQRDGVQIWWDHEGKTDGVSFEPEQIKLDTDRITRWPRSRFDQVLRAVDRRVSAAADHSFMAEFFARHPRLKPLQRVIKGTRAGTARGSELASVERGVIILKPEFFDAAKRYGEAFADGIYAHEIGHALDDAVGTSRWAKHAQSIGLDVWGDLPLGQFNMTEALAEAVSVVLMRDRRGLKLLHDRWPRWLDLIAWVLENAGARITTPTNAATETTAAREIYFHGTSTKLGKQILSEGFVPNPKKKIWDPERGKLASYDGTYLTKNFMTAASAASNAAIKFGGRQMIFEVQIETRAALMDEDQLPNMSGPIDNAAGYYLLEMLRNKASDKWRGQQGRQENQEFLADTGPRGAGKIVDRAVDTWLNRMVEELAEGVEPDPRFIQHLRGPAEKLAWATLRAAADGVDTLRETTREVRDATDQVMRAVGHIAKLKDDFMGKNARVRTPIGFKGANKILSAIVAPQHYDPISVEYKDRDGYPVYVVFGAPSSAFKNSSKAWAHDIVFIKKALTQIPNVFAPWHQRKAAASVEAAASFRTFKSHGNTWSFEHPSGLQIGVITGKRRASAFKAALEASRLTDWRKQAEFYMEWKRKNPRPSRASVAAAVAPPKALLHSTKGVKGPNGAVAVGYQWISEMAEEYSAHEQGGAGKRVSNWAEAVPCETCGRKIVHVYWVRGADHRVRPYGGDHLHVALGYDREMTNAQLQRLRSKVTNVQHAQDETAELTKRYRQHIEQLAVPWGPGATREANRRFTGRKRSDPIVWLVNRKERRVMRGDDLAVDRFIKLMDGWERLPVDKIAEVRGSVNAKNIWRPPWEMTKREFVSTPYAKPRSGYVSLFHATSSANIDSIVKRGLLLSKATGYESPNNMLWATSGPTGYSTGSPLVQFQVPKDSPNVQQRNADYYTVTMDVPPADILSIHVMWPDTSSVEDGDWDPYKSSPFLSRSDIVRTKVGGKAHKMYVEAALAGGFKVPAAVLRDYPDLKTGTATLSKKVWTPEGQRYIDATTRWYHGSKNPIEAFDRVGKWRAFDGKTVSRPVWLTRDRKFAQLNAGHQGHVYEVAFTPRRTFPDDDLMSMQGRYLTPTKLGERVIEALRSGAINLGVSRDDLGDDATEILKAMDRRDYDVMETGAVINWARRQGYDSIWVRGDGPENLMVLDPTNVKVVTTASLMNPGVDDAAITVSQKYAEQYGRFLSKGGQGSLPSLARIIAAEHKRWLKTQRVGTPFTVDDLTLEYIRLQVPVVVRAHDRGGAALSVGLTTLIKQPYRGIVEKLIKTGQVTAWTSPEGQRYRVVEDLGDRVRVEIQRQDGTSLPAEQSWTFTKEQFERMKKTLPRNELRDDVAKDARVTPVAAKTIHVPATAATIPFNVGDVVLYGKYKNKRGRIVSFGRNPKGQLTVEIEPIPRGRKHNKEMGLFKIWTTADDVEAVTAGRGAIVTAARRTFYHGTTMVLAKQILSEGFVPDPSKKIWDAETGAQQSYTGTYFTPQPRTAARYASEAARKIGGIPVVFEVQIETRSGVFDEDEIYPMPSAVLSGVTGHVVVFNQNSAGWLLTDKRALNAVIDDALPYWFGKPTDRGEASGKRTFWPLWRRAYPNILPDARYLAAVTEAARGAAHAYIEDVADGVAPGNSGAKYRKAVTKLFRTMQRSRFEGSAKNIRVTTPVTFRGANRIVAAVADHVDVDYKQNVKKHEFWVLYGNPDEQLITDRDDRWDRVDVVVKKGWPPSSVAAAFESVAPARQGISAESTTLTPAWHEL